MSPLPLLLLASSLASEPDDEMIIEDQATSEEAREVVEVVMASLGYRARRSRNGRTVYRAGSRPQVGGSNNGPTGSRTRASLSPVLVLDDEGYVFTRGRNRRTIGSAFSGNYRRGLGLRAEVFITLDPAVDAWLAALQREHMADRYFQLPDQLAATWETGARLGSHPAGATPADRRAALLAFWASRTKTPEGERVRQLTADFIEHVVQDSPWPVTTAEIAAAEADCQCGPLLP